MVTQQATEPTFRVPLLEWDPVANADCYNLVLYRGTQMVASSSPGSPIDTSVQLDTGHDYEVRLVHHMRGCAGCMTICHGMHAHNH